MDGVVQNEGGAPSSADSNTDQWDALVFVYGTLKRGEPNHGVLLEPMCGRAELLGREAHTVQAFPLVVAGPYNIPYCLDRPGSGKVVCGEVYRVDRIMLDSLDVLEGYPHHYTRRLEEVEVTECTGHCSNRRVQAWIYLLAKFSDDLLKLPCLTSYSASSSDVAPYVPRHERT